MPSRGFTWPRGPESLKALRAGGFSVLGPAAFRVAALAVLLISGCGRESANPVDTDQDECPAGQWAEDTSDWYAYSHDCNPYEGQHFTVYSDGSSRAAKLQLAGIAEGHLDVLVEEFNVESMEDDLGFKDGYTYYIYAEKYIDVIRAMGFRNGFFIGAIDCVTVPGYYTRNPTGFGWTVRHELVHVLQFTLTGCPSNDACPDWLGFWFREGQAVYMCGAGERVRVTTLAEFLEWWPDETHINPVSIHRFVDFPDRDRFGEYYRMFGLAYAYLVDSEHGRGATIEDMRGLFAYMDDGDSFEDAFNKALGISVPWYRDNFYSLMEDYLSGTAADQPVAEAQADLFEAFPETFHIHP